MGWPEVCWWRTHATNHPAGLMSEAVMRRCGPGLLHALAPALLGLDLVGILEMHNERHEAKRQAPLQPLAVRRPHAMTRLDPVFRQLVAIAILLQVQRDRAKMEMGGHRSDAPNDVGGKA